MKAWLLDVSVKDGDLFTTWITKDKAVALKVPMARGRLYLLPGKSINATALKTQITSHPQVHEIRSVRRFVSIHDKQRKPVLEIKTTPGSVSRVVRDLRKLVPGRWFNIDMDVFQQFCLDTGLFPYCEVMLRPTPRGSYYWKLHDQSTVLAGDYDLPPASRLGLACHFGRNSAILKKVEITLFSKNCTNSETITFSSHRSERQLIQETVNYIREIDPDIILTTTGDVSLFHFAKRAVFRRLGHLTFDRPHVARPFYHLPGLKRDTPTSVSFMSYGRIYHKLAGFYFRGRQHIDVRNSFFWKDGHFAGIVELGRLSLMNPQKISRSTIGTVLTGLQIKTAYHRGVLIPARKSDAEAFRPATCLLHSDRGGHIYMPIVGLHFNVTGLDFSSMYPEIMVSRNISPETLNCKCCETTRDYLHSVPELNFHTCQRFDGLIPEVLREVLRRRRHYKQRKYDFPFYDDLQSTLKWLLVTCFGYLGYRNARFGRIECHETINAWGRKSILTLGKIVEEHGLEIIAGIVDSIWLKNPSGESIPDNEIKTILEECKTRTHLPIDSEGLYKWIVFLPRREEPTVGVLNRYYGVFEEGGVKVRGIEARRHDAPSLIKELQLKILDILRPAQTKVEFQNLLSHARKLVESYKKHLLVHATHTIEKFAVTKVISKLPNSYVHNTHQAIAAKLLQREGFSIQPGMKVSYLIIDSRATDPNLRVIPMELYDRQTIDRHAYEKLLDDALANIIPPGLTTTQPLLLVQ